MARYQQEFFRKFTPNTDVALFSMTNIYHHRYSEQLKINKYTLTVIVCFFPVLMIEIKEELKSQQRTEHAQSLNNHAHSAILQTDALKL